MFPNWYKMSTWRLIKGSVCRMHHFANKASCLWHTTTIASTDMATVSKTRFCMCVHLTHVLLTVTFLYSKQKPWNLTFRLALTTARHGQLSSAGIQTLITLITKTWTWTPSRTSHICPYLTQLPSIAVYPLLQTDHVWQVLKIPTTLLFVWFFSISKIVESPYVQTFFLRILSSITIQLIPAWNMRI